MGTYILWIIEKARDFQKNIYFYFIDYVNTFDCVDHNKLWKILQEMGIPDHLTCLLRNLYAGQETTVRTGHGTTNWFQIGKGVHQGCIVSPCLFNFYAESTRRRLWHPTPILLPGKSHGWRSLCAAVHGVTESWTRLRDFTFTFHFHALEKEMATHSSVLAWRIPGMEPGGLPSMGSHRVRHDWSDLAAAAAESIACEMPGRMKHKLEWRFPGEILITSDMQMTSPLWQKVKRN